jgi:predicted nucleotide-binding protein
MQNVAPKYEILYTDLKKHKIGKYLISREFKLYMNKTGNYQLWSKYFETAKNSRRYFAMGIDFSDSDSETALGYYFNILDKIKDYAFEEIITLLISNFIDWSKSKKDFSDILESAINAGFSNNNINIIEWAIISHNNKEFPEVEEKIKDEEIKIGKIDKPMNLKDVFVVHGHNEAIKLEVVRTLEKLKLNPIVLHEQANGGLTIIEKFEKHSEVGFAVVLLTYDDFGNSKSNEDKQKRARQNVVFELGYFIGKLGRHKVMPLYENGVELPSDMSGVVYELLDSGGAWKLKLCQELKEAGFNVNANKLC